MSADETLFNAVKLQALQCRGGTLNECVMQATLCQVVVCCVFVTSLDVLHIHRFNQANAVAIGSNLSWPRGADRRIIIMHPEKCHVEYYCQCQQVFSHVLHGLRAYSHTCVDTGRDVCKRASFNYCFSASGDACETKLETWNITNIWKC